MIIGDMKFIITKIERHEFETVTTNEKYMNQYRRHGPDHWDHKLGVYGWHRYMDPALLEKAYEDYKRERPQDHPGLKDRPPGDQQGDQCR